MLVCLRQMLRARLIGNAFLRYGPGHVVVTGGANGVGLQWAITLAGQGFGVVLVDIDEGGLQKAKEAVRKAAGGMDVRTVVFDFSRCDDCEEMERLVDDVTQGLDVCMLVNNVGMMRDAPVFTNTDPSVNAKVCKVNMLTMMVLTQILYTRVFSKRTKRSAVINMSSFSGVTPWPGTAVYSASKAFVQTLSVCMSKELEGSVDVLCLSPLGIGTELIGVSADKVAILSPAQVVNASLPYVGVVRSTYGHWLHALQAGVLLLVGGEARLSMCQFLQTMSKPPAKLTASP